MCKNDLVQIGENRNIILLPRWRCERAFRNDVKNGKLGYNDFGCNVGFF